MQKKTKILATVGPSSDSADIIEGMIKTGVNVFRLNFSHGDHEYHSKNLKTIREVSKKINIRVGVLQDICGPKIRVGKLKKDFILNIGDKLEIYGENILGEKISYDTYRLSINKPEILKLLKVGENIYFYDGSIRTKIIQTEGKIVAEVQNSGFLASNKGINFPNTKLNMEVLTQKDKDDILWAIKNDVDFIAVSFVQKAQDVLNVREILQSNNAKINVLAKIEKFDALENIDEIIEVSDGIMIARGDLGIEVPYYKVPRLQKSIIEKTNAASKPVITATQMLLSMTKSEAATRAEISDVANAVLDGTDAVMLSEETAIGIDPINVVKVMANTIQEIEKVYPYDKFEKFEFLDETDIITSSTARLASELETEAIISLTSSGKSAMKLARYRTKVDIFAVTHDEKTARLLSIIWGVVPILTIKKDKLNLILARAVKKAKDEGFLNLDSSYIITAGYPTGVPGNTNFIRYLKKEQMEYYIKLVQENDNV